MLSIRFIAVYFQVTINYSAMIFHGWGLSSTEGFADMNFDLSMVEGGYIKLINN